MAEQLVNTVSECVEDSLRGLLLQNPGLRALRGQPRVVLRADVEEYKAGGRVSLLVGGGSGHEPAMLGFVGPGMATCAVMGSLFASPGPRPILEGLRAAGRGAKGIVMLIGNYTGDRLNFGLAMERAREEGLKVEMLLHSDDCALIPHHGAGRRGLAGYILLIKMYGAMLEAGHSIEDIKHAHDAIQREIVTLGVCLKPCRLPGVGPLFSIPAGCMELGLGLHGEAGAESIQMQNAHDLIHTMLSRMRSDDNPFRLDMRPGQSFAILLNNLCSVSELEMNILLMESITQMEELGVCVTRAYAGRLITSMDMTGFSLTVMLMNDTRAQMLDAPTSAISWPRPYLPEGIRDRFNNTPLEDPTSAPQVEQQQSGVKVSSCMTQCVEFTLRLMCARVCESEALLNRLDSGAGDGDCGSTLATGAQAILRDLDDGKVSVSCPSAMLNHLAHTLEGVMGGCSGALYSLLLTGASSALVTDVSPSAWLQGLQNGIELISRYGGAMIGDRTMLDPLQAAALSLQQTLNDGSPITKNTFELIVKAAESQARATAAMKAGAGRASYVRAELLDQPDAGATAIALMARAMSDGMWPIFIDDACIKALHKEH